MQQREELQHWFLFDSGVICVDINSLKIYNEKMDLLEYLTC